MAPPVFPTLPGVAYSIKRGIDWSVTGRATALSGKRTRVPRKTYPTYMYDLPYDFLRTDATLLELQTLAGFINLVNGPGLLFAYLDPYDSVATQNSFGLGDGVSTKFQLTRAVGGFSEPVFLPVLDINSRVTQVRVSGIATTAYTVDSLGNVNFTSPPSAAAALDWTGTFYWPCRFDEDVNQFELFNLNLYANKSLKFSTEKLP